MTSNDKSDPQARANAKRDLWHFLNLAAAQIRHQMKTLEPSEGKYSEKINRLCVLEELIKEQASNHGK